jgi:hypothetical protein
MMERAPSAASWGPDRIDVFVSSGNALFHKWLNGGWSFGWENLGGILTTPLAVASPGLNLLTTYTRGTDGHLWGKWFNGGWSDWYEIGCCLGGDSAVLNSVATISQGVVETDVFVIGTLHDLYVKRYINAAQGWTDWQYLDHTFDYTNIAATAWVPAPPPSGPDQGCRHC